MSKKGLDKLTLGGATKRERENEKPSDERAKRPAIVQQADATIPVFNQGQTKGFPKQAAYTFIINNWLKKYGKVANDPTSESVFDKLVRLEPKIQAGSTETTLINFLKARYNEFVRIFGSFTYERFIDVLKRWTVYPVPISFSAYLGFYISCYNSWNQMPIIKSEIEKFDEYYVLYETNDLISTWDEITTRLSANTLQEKFEEFEDRRDDFDAHISAVYPNILSKKGDETTSNTTIKDNTMVNVVEPVRPESEERMRLDAFIFEETKMYNKLLNCLDVGKDACLQEPLSIPTHGEFMLKNVINPLFDFENKSGNIDPSMDEQFNSVRDPFNFKGVGNKSKELSGFFMGRYDTNMKYIPIIKNRDGGGTVDPSIEEGFIKEMERQKGKEFVKGVDNFYTLQDAGYGPVNLFRNYKILLTTASILDPAGKTIDNHTIDLTRNNKFQIRKETLAKYSLDTCIENLSITFDELKSLYAFKFQMKEKTVSAGKVQFSEYFFRDQKNVFRQANSIGSVYDPNATFSNPMYFAAGNAIKNRYIKDFWRESRAFENIRKYVLLKELGDTLQVAMLDQLLEDSETTLAQFPQLGHLQRELPFIRGNTVITTNDYILLCRCLLNNINCVMTSGKNVVVGQSTKKIGVPYYSLTSPTEIAARNEELKKHIISDLYSKNKYVVDLLREIATGDNIEKVIYMDKSIMEQQKEYLANVIKKVSLTNKNYYIEVYGRTIEKRKYLFRSVLYYISFCLEFVNERIQFLLQHRAINPKVQGSDNKLFYESFLNEAARLRFESPFDVIKGGPQDGEDGEDGEENGEKTTVEKYIYKPFKQNKFSFLPYLPGTKLIDSTKLKLEKWLTNYSYYNSKYYDFSLIHLFKIDNIDDISKIYYTYRGEKFENLSNLYELLNNRIEINSFLGNQVHDIVTIEGTMYLSVIPLIFLEVESNQMTENQKEVFEKEKEKTFYKCIKPFDIENLFYNIGWGRLDQEWIYETNVNEYPKNIELLHDFSQILPPSDTIKKLMNSGKVRLNDYIIPIEEPVEITTESMEIKINEFNNSIIPAYDNIVTGQSFLDEINAIYRQEVPNKEINFSMKEGKNTVYIDSKETSIIEDTLVLEDITAYSSTSVAKQIYLKKEIAEAINQIIEESEIGIIKNMIREAPLSANSKEQCFNEADKLSMENFRQLKKELYDSISKSIDVIAFGSDTQSNKLFLNDAPIITDNIKSQIRNKVVNYRDTVILPALEKIIIDKKGGGRNGRNGLTTLTNNEIDTTAHTIVDLSVKPGILVLKEKMNVAMSTSTTTTSFEKYIQTNSNPGLLTYHMLCYFPNIIFMVYAYAKYVENHADVLEKHTKSYPGMSISALKNYARMFFERDFSDELNIVFSDANTPAYVEVDVDIENVDEINRKIAVKKSEYKVYDNVTAFFMHVAGGMMNTVGLFKYSKAGLELAPFILQGGSDEIFTYIHDKSDKHTIVNMYDVLFYAEEYVCETHGPLRGENSILMLEKFIANGVYEDPTIVALEKTSVLETETIAIKTPMQTSAEYNKIGAPIKQAENEDEDPTMRNLASNLANMGLKPRKLFENVNVNENPQNVAYVYGGRRRRNTRRRKQGSRRRVTKKKSNK